MRLVKQPFRGVAAHGPKCTLDLKSHMPGKPLMAVYKIERVELGMQSAIGAGNRLERPGN